jgi:predicted transposase YdaD
MDMIKYVLRHIAAGYDNIVEGVTAVMGGTVLECESKKIYNEGIREGILEGKRKGRNEGRVISLFYDSNYSIAEISVKTGMSEDEIEYIVNEYEDE